MTKQMKEEIIVRTNTKTSSNPLIYIKQPKFSRPFENKQVTFVKAIPKTSQTETENEEQKNEKQSENKIENGMHKTGFLNKTLDDKLKILTKLPKSIPNLLCELTTKENTYTCTIAGYSDEKVYIRLPESEEEIEIDKNDILSLIIINL